MKLIMIFDSRYTLDNETATRKKKNKQKVESYITKRVYYHAVPENFVPEGEI